MNKFIKLILLVKSILYKNLFKKSTLKNTFEFKSIQYGKKSISLGDKNIFKKFSKISVDYNFEKQFINIGSNNKFESFSVIKSQGGYINIGNNNFFGERVQVQGFGGVEIGDNCMFAPNCFISSSNHDFSNPNSKEYLLKEIGKKTIIGNSTWFGANCILLSGIEVGNFCIIGAGSVITKNIPDYHIAVGNPAKLIKRFDLNKNEWIKINVDK